MKSTNQALDSLCIDMGCLNEEDALKAALICMDGFHRTRNYFFVQLLKGILRRAELNKEFIGLDDIIEKLYLTLQLDQRKDGMDLRTVKAALL